MTENWFNNLCHSVFTKLKPSEELSLGLKGEDTDYVRFNNAKIRQSTFVKQRKVEMTFQQNQRQIVYRFDLQQTAEQDLQTCLFFLDRCRAECESLPSDPHCVPMVGESKSTHSFKTDLPSAEEFCPLINRSTAAADLAGIFATGDVYRAFQNSHGINHWYHKQEYFFDYSMYTKTPDGQNKALKNCFSESKWNQTHLENQFSSDFEKLKRLSQNQVTIKPGKYRTYFEPAANHDLVSMLSWNGLSLAAFKQNRSPMKKLASKEVQLSDRFSIYEDFNQGLSPQFNSTGELAPEVLPLITNGVLKNFLVSSRSAQEYNMASNGADIGLFGMEFLRSAVVKPGQLPASEVLKALDTGIYVGNLHYLNWSDLQSARITGMTRFACFWVENGQIKAPIGDMRFDSSFYDVFGSHLVDFTDHSAVIPSVDSYIERSVGGLKVPGALVTEFNFVL